MRAGEQIRREGGGEGGGVDGKRKRRRRKKQMMENKRLCLDKDEARQGRTNARGASVPPTRSGS